MQKNASLSPTSPDIYPKYRVVRKYDQYAVEMQSGEFESWKPVRRARYSHGLIPGYVEYNLTFKKEKEAIKEATKLSERSLQYALRNTENTVVWGPSP